MKTRNMIIFLLAGVLLLSTAACSQEESAPDTAPAETQEGTWRGDLQEPENLKQEFSYAFAHLFTSSYMQEGIEFDPEYFFQGMKEATEGTESAYSTTEVNDILTAYQAEVTALQQEQQNKVSQENLQEAEDFLATNRTREGVRETDSGLQYEVVTQGDGLQPSAEDVVTVHYRGTFLNGAVFDSSRESGTPATFPLSSVIEGWTEGVQLMPVGSTYRFYIHPDLAYGQQGAGAAIGPNKLLIFEIELLEIEEE
jgi:FKBP-type peptidyl-prolyl cis-trans isomerase